MAVQGRPAVLGSLKKLTASETKATLALLPRVPFITYQGRDSIREKADSIDRWNFWCFALHLTSAVCLIALTLSNEQWPVYATIMHPDWKPCDGSLQSCSKVQCKITMVSDVVGKVPLEWLVFAFHIMSVIAHACNRWFFRETYYMWLCRKMNPGRWLEYFFSASIMQTVIMVLTGFTDVWTLVLSTVMIGVTQFFGHITEQVLYYSRYEPKPLARLEKWQYYLYGWVSFIPPWVGVYYSFYWAILNTKGDGPPDWVQAIVWTLILAFSCFAGVMAWYIYNWDSKDVSFRAEKAYCFFSLLSKTILTWQLYFGAFSRENRTNKIIAYDPTNPGIC
tara:strand:- start:731 stop:1735 length:1005 start_codon:yes stop_codon:yes gene_type:complete